MYNLAEKLIAEFLGTFTIVLISTGSICADQYLAVTGKPNLGTLGIAVAAGMAVGGMVTAIGRISGGHFNPAVTIGLWVTRRLGSLATILYWAAQLLGAMAGAYTVKAIVSDSFWEPVALGTPALAPDFSRTHGMALEGVTTFLWVLVFFATVVDTKGASERIAVFAMGLAVAMGTLLAYPFTGAAMNPARAFGPALASGHWTNHGVYWVGPLFGGVLASVIYDRIFLRQRSP
ncbi:MAG TPA: aquaporin [Candidatus Acidoferrales bacterium]|nr:aquaporin [Candidatus Acidoferrales bacterium]